MTTLVDGDFTAGFLKGKIFRDIIASKCENILFAGGKVDKLLTINDWWDGPVMGLATYNGAICIYSRVFDISEDEYLDEYLLTPIDDAEVEMILKEWNEWCFACLKNDLGTFYKKYLNNRSITQVLENSSEKNKYRKRAIFTGNIGKGLIPVDCCVEWHE